MPTKMSRRDCPLSPGSLVWAYARDSGGDTQELSVQQQGQAIHTYCERFDLVLVHVFEDKARPGSSVIGREAFDDLVHLAHQNPPPVEGIIVWSFSRFARNLLDAQFHKADLRRRGYELISLTEDLPGGDYAPIIEALIDWKNERFLKDLSRDVQRGLCDLARKGYAPGGFPPIGYKAEKVTIGRRRDGSPHVVSRWVPDPGKADLVRKAWWMRADGATYSEIHEETRLYTSKSSYATMFGNETYRGVLKCGDLKIEGGLEALVDEETWEIVQKRRQSYKKRLRSTREHPKRTRSPFLLSGLVVCAECGDAMSGGIDGRHRRHPWRHYVCGRKKRKGWHSCPTGKVSSHVLDQAVLDTVIERVLTPDYVLALMKEVNTHLALDGGDVEREIDGVKRQLADVEKAIENLLDLAEQYGVEAAGDRLMKREAEREGLAGRLRKLERQRELHKLKVDPEVVKTVLMEMRGTLEGDEIQAKRVLLKRFVERVEVSKESARLVYTCPISDTVYDISPRWGYSIKYCIEIDLATGVEVD
jgi:site-specific DNA recombinase